MKDSSALSDPSEFGEPHLWIRANPLDYVVICFITIALLAIALSKRYYYAVSKTSNRSNADDKGAARGYLVYSSVTHARLLPVASKHSFTYPALYLFVSVKALEAGELDTGFGGWAFGYLSAWRRLLAVSPRECLDDGGGKQPNLVLERLRVLLESRGYMSKGGGVADEEVVDDAWMLCMPGFLGKAAFNPLTVYFVYTRTIAAEDQGGELKFVVLEIQNTFGESNVHVLEVGKCEDSGDVRTRGYDHQWTFPREFHVSPFNDRSGYYTVAVKRPTHPPNGHSSSDAAFPRPSVSVHLYTENPNHSAPVDETPSLSSSHASSLANHRGELKLTALLRLTEAVPLSGSSVVLHALSRMPIDLLLTMPRILYQAWILHYGKPRLRIYLRPDMAWPRWARNIRDAANLKLRKVGGGVRWLEEGMLEKYARWRVERFVERRSNALAVAVTLIPANPLLEIKRWEPNRGGEVAGNQNDAHLEISYLSSKFFAHLLLCPTARHALLLGCDAEKQFGVSSRRLFYEVFSGDDEVASRRRWSPSQSTRLKNLPSSFVNVEGEVPGQHFLDGSWLFGVLDSLVIVLLSWLGGFEKWVFSSTKVNLVEGTVPWLAWDRAAKHGSLHQIKIHIGSERHEEL